MMKIPLSRPDITDKEREAIVANLMTPYLSLGPKLEEFERKMAEYTGVKYAVAVNSGTSALHLVLEALDVRDDDEVITTPFSFIASANCILFQKAKPVFVDIDPETLNINTDLIEERITEKTKAILAVDVFGHPAEWDKLEEIAKKHGLKLIEDSCEALGSKYKGKMAGSFGDAGTFAFYPNKQITTGEGGIVVTADENVFRICKSVRNQGREAGDEWLSHVRLGYNYRISDINCTLGLAQMERIDEILEKRTAVAKMYNEKLSRVTEVDIPYVSPDVKMSWFVYVVRLKESFNRTARDRILKNLRDKGIECSNYFPPIHLQPFYADKLDYKKGDFPVTEFVSERTIALPFYNNLTERHVDAVVKALEEGLSGKGKKKK